MSMHVTATITFSIDNTTKLNFFQFLDLFEARFFQWSHFCCVTCRQAGADNILNTVYIGNTDAQMSKVHSYYNSFACC